MVNNTREVLYTHFALLFSKFIYKVIADNSCISFNKTLPLNTLLYQNSTQMYCNMASCCIIMVNDFLHVVNIIKLYAVLADMVEHLEERLREGFTINFIRPILDEIEKRKIIQPMKSFIVSNIQHITTYLTG